MRTRVKICGITRSEDALAAARLGADAIGLVFYADSPRVVDATQAAEICASLPPFVSRVGLFVNADAEEVRGVMSDLPLDILQFHGEESAEFCRQFGRPYIKALRMHEQQDIHDAAAVYNDVAALLLDAYVADQLGGTGQTFDWERIPSDLSKPVVLAGGLRPDNVAEAISSVRPFAVDVSSGVEQDPGIKDIEKMAIFIKEVNRI
ncbi:MAG: phosphoribosylanthranilate isomerase [Gammaproteobacteria bacterium]|nr:MAG: phosphoribosylanthranilate isomerase [Gammaproteobacteria bacterium]